MSKICDVTRNAVQPILESMNIELVDVEYKTGKRGENDTLWIFIDTENGVDFDVLEKANEALDSVLEEVDPTNGSAYTLNISSPGLDRAFKTQRDFDRNMGKEVEVKLYAPLDGKKLLVGELVKADDNTIIIKIKDKEVIIEKTKIAKVNKAIKFD